jgi:hypothetical protein
MNRHLQNMLAFAISSVPDTRESTEGQRRPRSCKACNTVGSMVLHHAEVYHVRQGSQVIEKELPSWHECRFCHAQDTI